MLGMYSTMVTEPRKRMPNHRIQGKFHGVKPCEFCEVKCILRNFNSRMLALLYASIYDMQRLGKVFFRENFEI